MTNRSEALHDPAHHLHFSELSRRHERLISFCVISDHSVSTELMHCLNWQKIISSKGEYKRCQNCLKLEFHLICEHTASKCGISFRVGESCTSQAKVGAGKCESGNTVQVGIKRLMMATGQGIALGSLSLILKIKSKGVRNWEGWKWTRLTLWHWLHCGWGSGRRVGDEFAVAYMNRAVSLSPFPSAQVTGRPLSGDLCREAMRRNYLPAHWDCPIRALRHVAGQDTGRLWRPCSLLCYRQLLFSVLLPCASGISANNSCSLAPIG